jgi:hypothetical protein
MWETVRQQKAAQGDVFVQCKAVGGSKPAGIKQDKGAGQRGEG